MTIRDAVYISGPMTGMPEFNYPAFHRAARMARRFDWWVFNPAENFGGDTTRTYAEYIRADLRQLLDSKAIALLPGYHTSKGSRYELLTAQLLGLEIRDAITFDLMRVPPVVTSFV